MLIRKPSATCPSEITPPELFRRRREFIKAAGAIGAAAGLGLPLGFPTAAHAQRVRLFGVGKSPLSIDDKLQNAAQSHANDMKARKYVAHESPDKTGPFDRMLKEEMIRA